MAEKHAEKICNDIWSGSDSIFRGISRNVRDSALLIRNRVAMRSSYFCCAVPQNI